MDTSQAEWKIYQKAARERKIRHRAEIEARRKRAWELAYRAAAVLKDEFEAKRVVVFGSLLYTDRFHLQSDIDLAVWDECDYFRAISRLLDLDPDFEFDLVPFDEASIGLRTQIEREGVEL